MAFGRWTPDASISRVTPEEREHLADMQKLAAETTEHLAGVRERFDLPAPPPPALPKRPGGIGPDAVDRLYDIFEEHSRKPDGMWLAGDAIRCSLVEQMIGLFGPMLAEAEARGRAEEREACARECDALAEEQEANDPHAWDNGVRSGAMRSAARIRRRTEQATGQDSTKGERK